MIFMFLIIGAGSIGKRHINNLNISKYTDIDVIDVNKESLNYVKNHFQINETFNDLDTALA